MTAIVINKDDTFEEWRSKTNQIGQAIENVTAINSSIQAVNDTVAISTVSTERFIVDAIGNIGESITPSAWATANKAYQMPAGSLYSLAGTTQGVSQNAYLSGTGWKYVATGYASRYEQFNGTHNWFTAASGSAGGNASLSQKMLLDANGNLGINILSMTYKFEIGASGVIALNDSTNSNKGTLQMVSGGLEIYTGAGKYIAFGTNSSEDVRVDSGGNFLRGTTTSVFGGDQTGYMNSNGAQVGLWGTSSTYGGTFIGTYSNHSFGVLTNNTTRIFVDTAGNVGIGTSTPSAKFGVSDGSTALFKVYPQTGTTILTSRNSNDTAYTSTIYDGIQHIFRYSGSEAMRVDTSGNVVVTGVGGLGYGTGSGGSIIQATNKSTAVTLHKTNGQIVTAGTAINAGNVANFTFYNNKIAATDIVLITFASGMVTAGSYNLSVDSTATGLCVISIRNLTAGNLSETLTLNFSVVKAVTA